MASRSGFRPPACTSRGRRHDAAAATASRGLPGLRRGRVPRARRPRAPQRVPAAIRRPAASAQDRRHNRARSSNRCRRRPACDGRRVFRVWEPPSRGGPPVCRHRPLWGAEVLVLACGNVGSASRSHGLRGIALRRRRPAVQARWRFTTSTPGCAIGGQAPRGQRVQSPQAGARVCDCAAKRTGPSRALGRARTSDRRPRAAAALGSARVWVRALRSG